MADDLVRIWYVAPQRLCNFRCGYCVSTGDYAKSVEHDWRHERDRDDFRAIVRWIGTRPFPVGVRLATLGEPFASSEFLEQASWLTRQPRVAFVELLTNGSLLRRRLPRLEGLVDFAKLSLWITHHHTQISMERIVADARWAQEHHGCFVVVNGLLFPDNATQVAALREAALDAGLRFNLDLGYDPDTPARDGEPGPPSVPLLERDDGVETALRLGAHPDLIGANLTGLYDSHGHACAAGHRYFYIGIEGDVYPCSRYYALSRNKLGNVLSRGFELELRAERWTRCEARFGCCRKEDFLNLEVAMGCRRTNVPSLGWVGPEARPTR